jgi:hypothetical protein
VSRHGRALERNWIVRPGRGTLRTDLRGVASTSALALR